MIYQELSIRERSVRVAPSGTPSTPRVITYRMPSFRIVVAAFYATLSVSLLTNASTVPQGSYLQKRVCGCPLDNFGDEGEETSYFATFQCAYPNGACTWKYLVSTYLFAVPYYVNILTLYRMALFRIPVNPIAPVQTQVAPRGVVALQISTEIRDS